MTKVVLSIRPRDNIWASIQLQLTASTMIRNIFRKEPLIRRKTTLAYFVGELQNSTKELTHIGFRKFYKLAFPSVYQANSVIRQAYTQLVSTLTKETLTPDDKDLAERLLIKLVKSINYHYSSNKPIALTAQLIWKVITKIIRFVEGNASHTVLAKIKRKEEKDWAPTSIFDSFLEKLGEKGKEYVPVENPIQVDNPDQTFKVFEGRAFDKKIHSLRDTSDILGSLLGRESPELTQMSRVTKDYNLQSRS